MEIRKKHSLPLEEVSERIRSRVPAELEKQGLKITRQGETWFEAERTGAKVKCQWDEQEVRLNIDLAWWVPVPRDTVREALEKGLNDLLA